MQNIQRCVLPRFLYFLLKNLEPVLQGKKQGAGIPGLNRKQILDLSIPVPPIEVQNEIVRILDTLTELTAELTARKQQYEYYRNSLLTFDDSVERKPLLSVAETFTGLTYRPSDKTNDGTGTVVLRSSNIQDGKLVFEDTVRVSMPSIPARAMTKAGDVLVCVRNGSKALVGKSVRIPKISEPMAFGAFMSVLRAKDSLDADYLYFVWQFVYDNIRKNNDDSMVINQITQKDFTKIEIPVPPLSEQKKIATLLDRFDKFCNDIVEGLPAEIKARQQQYEYYRNKLLTFDEVKA